MTNTLNNLYGRHVRLRPIDSTAKPTELSGRDWFGVLLDINTPEYLVLRDRHEPDTWQVHRAELYRVDPYPLYRVHVFFYPYNGENFWTWCREIGGNVLDSYSGLNRYDGYDDAWAAARKWLAGTEVKTREVSR